MSHQEMAKRQLDIVIDFIMQLQEMNLHYSRIQWYERKDKVRLAEDKKLKIRICIDRLNRFREVINEELPNEERRPEPTQTNVIPKINARTAKHQLEVALKAIMHLYVMNINHLAYNGYESNKRITMIKNKRRYIWACVRDLNKLRETINQELPENDQRPDPAKGIFDEVKT